MYYSAPYKNPNTEKYEYCGDYFCGFCSRILAELECLWDTDVMLSCSVCDVITKFATDNFNCYEKYTVKKSIQEMTMGKL